MTRTGVGSDDDLPPSASAAVAITKALIALALFGVSFVLFLIAPLALIVVVCLGLLAHDRWRRRAHQPARQMQAAPARTARGPVDRIDAAFRFGGQVEGSE